MWRIPEEELQVLGEWWLGRDILELGCGAARWLLHLLSGARPVGLDLSSRQLKHARH